ncbi:MAG: glycosyltransferase family 39 protein [Bacteroidales bacterium]|nr:glycosyltransferase family 39 protein [Bacteroidales bacterium]
MSGKLVPFIKQHFLPLMIIALVALIIGVRHLNEPPAYIHAWAQADNYSLALGFRHNGCDLFHPQTLIYNKQQYGFEDPESLVTGCDLPLHHWLVAVLMSVTGSTQPWVFRGLTLAVTILGLWALYLLAFVLTASRAKSLLVAVFMATSPSFAYYSSSFLPTTPALSLAVGGLLFYVLYLHDDKIWKLYMALLLITLSMMTRTSFAVLWVAVGCFQMLRIWRGEARFRSSWLPFVAGALLFAAWWLWSMHLRQQYGSLFLGSLLPVQNMDEAREVLQYVHDRWMFHYYQRIQHWLYVVVAVGAVVTLIFKGKKSKVEGKRLSLWWLLAIWMLGEVLFALAMSQQYADHDYYFLDSFYLPIVMSFAGLLSILPNPSKQWVRVAALAVVLAFTAYMTVVACRMQRTRRQEGVEALTTAIRYKNANRMLSETGYGSKDLRFLTLFSYPQNTPFVMMNREGYAVMWNDTVVVAHALTFDYDYILVEDEVYRREFDAASYILPRLQRLAGDGELSVCTLSDSVLHPTADHFFE